MRKFKFRVWSLKCKQWLKAIYLKELNLNPKFEIFFGKNYVIQQFAGLKDKNGKEIYEGDILEDKKGFTYEVFWLDANSSFELAEKQEKPDDYENPIFCFRDTLKLNIIGNIFENPELLKIS